MLLGFNMLLWSPSVAEEHFPMFAKLKATGYDGVELPIFGGTPEEFEKVGQAAKDEGLRVNGVAVIPDAEHDCTSADAKVRAAGLDHIKWAIDCLEAAGGEVL
jgi:D-psicose/D-tagatose/L-ribulose 3-epimerase